MLSDYAPLVIYAVIVVGVVGLLITLSNLLGPQKPYKSKLLPYESGIVPVDPARKRYSVRFYLTAMLFIIFDIEVVFMIPWAAAFFEAREKVIPLSPGLVILDMVVFMLILAVGYVYAWKRGALQWD